MDWMNKVGGILQQYAGSAAPQAPADINQHFDNVAEAVPQHVLAQGLSEAFQSNQTPAFGQMVGSLFSRSNPEQKRGILNHLLAGAGPSAVAWLAGKGLSGLVSGSGQVTPAAAAQVSPDNVAELATQAQKQDPSIIDSVSSFYAQHPALVKGLGLAALSIVMAKMSRSGS
jgi:hypothetical protein